MDEAVQRVKVIEEADNYVRRHYLDAIGAHRPRDMRRRMPTARAGVRIFDEAPGVFNLNTSGIVTASGSWDTDRGMADEYLSKMGHAYGNGFWGEPMEDVFRMALSGTEKVVHSSSTMLYGALDNDDFYMYMGGLGHGHPQYRWYDARARGHQHTRPGTTGDDGDRQVRWNRAAVTVCQSHMARGHAARGLCRGGEMRAFVEYLWGWTRR